MFGSFHFLANGSFKFGEATFKDTHELEACRIYHAYELLAKG